MVDIHNHVLYGVDDGAESLEESLAMLKTAKEQGINTVLATPHFYSFKTDAESYINKVESNFSSLSNVIDNEQYPKLLLGYEVHYFNDIHKSASIKKLTLNSGDYLLLELGHSVITDKVIDDILELRWQLNIKPIIAHIERYSKLKGYSKLLSILDHENYFSQITADSLFINQFKRTSMNLIKKGLVDFVASDAHNNSSRPFNLKKAYDFISRKYNSELANSIFSNSKNIF